MHGGEYPSSAVGPGEHRHSQELPIAFLIKRRFNFAHLHFRDGDAELDARLGDFGLEPPEPAQVYDFSLLDEPAKTIARSTKAIRLTSKCVFCPWPPLRFLPEMVYLLIQL
jgi:hypothetical protein